MTERPKAFDDEVLAFRPNMFAFALSLTNRNWQHAEDVVQSALARAFDKWEQYEPGTNLKAWLFTIARNCAYDRARKRKHDVEDPEGLWAATLVSTDNPLAIIELKEVRARMRFLNPIQRRVIRMIAMDGVTHEDTAAALGIPIGTTKSALSRARAFLETGNADVLEAPEEPPSQIEVPADQIAALFRAGASVRDIQAKVPGVSRSDVMQVVMERRLKAPRSVVNV